MLLNADILPQNTMCSNIRYDEPQKLGDFSPLAPPVYTLGYSPSDIVENVGVSD